jgi:hypothetical protein
VEKEEGLSAPLAILSDQSTPCCYPTSFTCFTVRTFLALADSARLAGAGATALGAVDSMAGIPPAPEAL